MDIEQLPADALFDVAYALHMRWITLTKEEHDVMTKYHSRIRNALMTSETGLPAIAALVPPADGSEIPQEIRDLNKGR